MFGASSELASVMEFGFNSLDLAWLHQYLFDFETGHREEDSAHFFADLPLQQEYVFTRVFIQRVHLVVEPINECRSFFCLKLRELCRPHRSIT